MIRICPERDGRCPHGMDCQFAIDRGSCDMAGSRASLSVDREREHAKPREGLAMALATAYHGRAVDAEYVNGAATGGSVFHRQAEDGLRYLISHGWITIDGLEAMKKERGME